MVNFGRFPAKYVVLATAGIIIYKLIKYKHKKRGVSKCIVIESSCDWEKYEKEILDAFIESKVIGIDCEWVTVNDKRRPVSLLQLANDNGFCVLVRLQRIPLRSLPNALTSLLSDASILKVGVGIFDDANKLLQDYFLEVQNFVDLRFLAIDLKELQGKNMGLKSLALELLGVDLNKSHVLRCSDWNAETLTEEQIKYASDDVIVSAKVFSEIQRRKTGWFPLGSKRFWNQVQNYVDIPFKQNLLNLNSSHKKFSVGLQRHNKTRYSKPRQKPMYDNCHLVAPDGELLCSCDKGKAEWYVSKGLGEIIKNEPFTVQLTFEPSGRPTLDNIFYTKEKSNCCVVCGHIENFHRKLVVPSEYRKFFPDLMKKNLSHDVLLLCVHCHKRSNILDQVMRQKLAELCDAPLGCKKNIKYQFDAELARVKSAAKALVSSGSKIPLSRQCTLKKIICDYYNIPAITDEILSNACDVEITSLNDSFVPHGQKVYQYFCQNGGLINFEKMWRQHFLDTMQPKYLPYMWSVDHNHKRLALQVINREREIAFDESILGLSPKLLDEVIEFEDIK